MRSLRSSIVPAVAVIAAAIVVSGCVTAGSSGNPPSPTQAPTPTTPASESVTGFYLRAWHSQALAPRYTFSWLPLVTVSDGQYIDGIVAVPAIYPGPLWVGPSVSTISPNGQAQIISTARALGLLGSRSTFVDAAPGAKTARIEMIVDGKTYELSGALDGVPSASPTPGTPEAFDTFWADVTGMGAWLAGELGQSGPYEPKQLAVMVTPPAEPTSGITANEVPWPLATPFATFGAPMPASNFRCAVVSGDDLAKLEPVIKQANQLTRFVDSAGTKESLVVRVMVPGERSPCSGL